MPVFICIHLFVRACVRACVRVRRCTQVKKAFCEPGNALKCPLLTLLNELVLAQVRYGRYAG